MDTINQIQALGQKMMPKSDNGSSVSDPDSLESGSGSSILAESGSGSRLQKLIDSKGLKC